MYKQLEQDQPSDQETEQDQPGISRVAQQIRRSVADAAILTAHAASRGTQQVLRGMEATRRSHVAYEDLNQSDADDASDAEDAEGGEPERQEPPDTAPDQTDSESESDSEPDERPEVHRLLDPEGFVYDKNEPAKIRLLEQLGHTRIEKRNSTTAHRVDTRTRLERNADDFRAFYSQTKEKSGDVFNRALKNAFRHAKLPKFTTTSSTSHTHASDAWYRKKMEEWVRDLLLGLISKGVYSPEMGVEFQGSDRTVSTFEYVVGHTTRVDHSTKDQKYEFINLKPISSDVKLVIMVDVDMRLSTQDMKRLLHLYKNASWLILGPRPTDACLSRDRHGDSDSYFKPGGSYASDTLPSRYGHDVPEWLFNWNVDQLNNTTELSRDWGGSTVIKNTCQVFNVVNRQATCLRNACLLTPVGENSCFYKTEDAKTYAVTDQALFARLEADSLYRNRNKWILHEAQPTSCALQLLQRCLPESIMRDLKSLYHGTKRYLRYAKRFLTCSLERDWTETDPRKCIPDLMLGQPEKFTPVIELRDPEGKRPPLDLIAWAVKSVGIPLGNNNQYHSYVTLSLAGSSVSYRMPIDCWHAIMVKSYGERGILSSHATVRMILKSYGVYQGTSNDQEARFKGLVDLIILMYSYKQPAVTVKDLEVMFYNNTIGSVTKLSDGEVTLTPALINTGRGNLVGNAAPPNRTMAAMERAVKERQQKPQEYQEAHADPEVTADCHAYMLQWAADWVSDNGPLGMMTEEDVLARMKGKQLDKYKRVYEQYPDFKKFWKEAVDNVRTDGTIVINSTFLKAECSKMDADVPEKDKPGRVITNVEARVQLFMKRAATPTYDEVLKKAEWFGMRKPSEAAQRMADIVKDCQASILGDGKKFEAHYGSWTTDMLMDVFSQLFGESWDPLQEEVYRACVYATGFYTVKEDGVDLRKEFSPNWVMPSGIVWTTIVNSMVNYAILLTFLIRSGMDAATAYAYLKKHACIGGDDQALGAITLRLARKFAKLLTETATALGFEWKTEVCVPYTSRYAETGKDDDGLDFEFTVDHVFLSRNFRGAFEGDINSCHDMRRLFTSLTTVESAKLPVINDQTRIDAMMRKILAFADGDGNSGSLYPKMLDRVHHLLNNKTEQQRHSAQLEARLEVGRYHEMTQSGGSWPNEPREWYGDVERDARAESHYTTDLDDAIVESIRLDKLAVFPPVISQCNREHEDELFHLQKQQWVRTFRTSMKPTVENKTSTPSPKPSPKDNPRPNTQSKPSKSQGGRPRNRGKAATTRDAKKNPSSRKPK